MEEEEEEDGIEKERIKMCLDCLERQIESDFSDKLIFSYALSRSPLPFASSALLQMSDCSEGQSSPEFVLVYLPRRNNHCFTYYVDEYCPEDVEGNDTNRLIDDSSVVVINQNQAEVSVVGILNAKTTSLETTSNASQYCYSNGGRKPFLAGLGCKSSTCYFSARFSCFRTITALAPIAQIGISSYASLKDISSSILSGFPEDHILSSLSLLIEGKSTGRDSINFLSLIGIPSFEEDSFPGCIRHPNIAPILGILKTSSHINLLFPKSPYTLENILHYSPNALKSDWHIRFLIYQFLSALAHMHGLGLPHGNICPSNVLLTDSCWCWLRVGDGPELSSNANPRSKGHWVIPPSKISCCIEGCSSQGIYADLKLSNSIDWHSCFNRWRRGELSNFEYLLVLNRLAGRRWGDQRFHTVMPWVIDFSVKPDENSDAGWRDLSKSKWRLAKGDEQLDFTYSTSEIPHHVSDECLSELAVCSYKARRLPLRVLRVAVRSVYEPNEYPSTMQRLYQWTPDECIPEFYCNPKIFFSLHSGMPDLAVPSWAGSPEEFIKLHREALESNLVSCQIHHWIDITFGYKMSGEAAVVAKNVMLPASATTMPSSVGRRQLFLQPHPVRRCATWKAHDNVSAPCQLNRVEGEQPLLLLETAHLQELEEVAAFCEHARCLGPVYSYNVKDLAKDESSVEELLVESSGKNTSRAPNYGSDCLLPSVIDINYLLENIEVDDDISMGYQELLLWKQKLSCSRIASEDFAKDIFSVGCILAELHLRRPLFDATSLAIYLESGVLPRLLQELPHHTEVLVEACIQNDWKRRPSAKCLLESPYFPPTVRSSYLFLAPLQLLAKDESRLRYVASFAKRGALKAMGTFATEMCAFYCLPLVVTPLSDIEADWAYTLLKEFLKCLTPKAVKTLVLPAIQKILQATGYSHLKLSLLQDSFVQEIWKQIGKQAYLETIHPLVISNLCSAPHKSSAAAASVLLIGSSEELGVPITVQQTIIPLIHCFGKGLSSDGIEVVVRIGSLFGENFVVKQILPLLRNGVRNCIEASYVNKPEPMQSWSNLSIMDCLMALDGLVAVLPREVIVKELIENGSCLYARILMHANLGIPVLQAAATSLVAICQQIGPDFTALHVLPKLKEIFDELAFSQETTNAFGPLGGNLKIFNTKIDDEYQIESRTDLVLLLYPHFASLLGIEKLRQCCATWLLLEQFLLRRHSWKWEYTGEPARSGLEIRHARSPSSSRSSTSEYSPAKLLLNGVGWSIPQSQGNRSAKNFIPHKRLYHQRQHSVENHLTTSAPGKHELWYWFPSPAAGWDGPDFLGRLGNTKEELPWKIRSSIVHSVRAHHGALRSFAVCRDECTVFSAGVGLGFKGTIQKWELSRMDCTSGYYGHEEVVNDICILPSSERVASCDGTVHVWNSQTGKLINVFTEFSANSTHLVNPSASAEKMNSDQANMLNFNSVSSGILTTAFDGNLYTSMHSLELVDMLVLGTGNGSLRFVDINKGQKLHLWRSESVDSSFPSLVSSMCCCGFDKMQANGAAAFPSWIAAGLSSGNCRLFDMRSGKLIASWQAHDGYVTKLAAPEDHLLVSSSLDRTLKIWDLRRNWTSQPIVVGGHNDSISSFSVWGQDVISISRNKIGVSCLSRSADEDGQQHVTPQYLYMANRESRNLSMLSSITILPFSRLFLVGTEDGFLRICC